MIFVVRETLSGFFQLVNEPLGVTVCGAATLRDQANPAVCEVEDDARGGPDPAGRPRIFSDIV